MRLLSQDSDWNNVRIQSIEVIIIVQVQNTRLVSNYGMSNQETCSVIIAIRVNQSDIVHNVSLFSLP